MRVCMSGRVRLNARHLLLKLFSLQAPKMELEGLDGEGDVIGNRSENEKARWTQAESLAVHHRYVVAGCFWCIKCAEGTVIFLV